jgi:hypothetical protein
MIPRAVGNLILSSMRNYATGTWRRRNPSKMRSRLDLSETKIRIPLTSRNLIVLSKLSLTMSLSAMPPTGRKKRW